MSVNMPILIVNQNIVFLKEVRQLLERQNYKVITSTNSLMAVQLFFQHKPRAVILSVSISQNEGFEVAREIRKFCQNTFILALSGNSFYVRAMEKLGADEVLPNWVEPAEVLSVMNIRLNTSATGIAVETVNPVINR